MRCIEMVIEFGKNLLDLGLTLTWDVLKSKNGQQIYVINQWLTLTWDVLKYKHIFEVWCYSYWLTLTWDVLKWLMML